MTVLGSSSTSAPATRKKITGHVGFSNLPNQIRRKSFKDGFQLTVMVVGESGLGKTTLINTLFNSTICVPREPLHPAADRPKTVAIENIQADIEENGVRLRLTVVDTPGFGDFVNNSKSWNPILEDIERRFEAYLSQEHRVRRGKLVDSRVHACVYFIQPTGHSLKQIDIEFMQKLHHRVNLIPVIAKADTMTDEDIVDFKARILSDLELHGINIFQAPIYEDDDDESIFEAEEIARAIPFAIVGSSNAVRTRDGRVVRGRAYPWGVVEVDNPAHCDFGKLRQLLIRTNMEELREHTNDVLFEAWRTERLLAMGIAQDPTVFEEINPAERLREERVIHEAKLAKMEVAMKEVFREKVELQEQKLKQSEVELYARHKEIKDELNRQWEDLSKKKAQLESGSPDASRKKTFRA
ncbi:putative cell division control protein CDC3 [Mycena albidolilacea]|uniref:Cell division control protein CDC3 n=1 Tax=Mycena albidolilacea TaxID=1033008 RepID=A0AAD7A8R3_9AGAR|nr:putative cell division control protein CDC3 [Mycena albidolilacea]